MTKKRGDRKKEIAWFNSFYCLFIYFVMLIVCLLYSVVFRMFLTSVKRLRIMRTSEANGLGT